MSAPKQPKKIRIVKTIFLFFRKMTTSQWAIIIATLPFAFSAISIYDYFNDGPEFNWFGEGYLDVVQIRRIDSPLRVITRQNSILIVGAIYNNGKQPLFPGEFSLTAKYKGQKPIELQSVSLIDTSLKSNIIFTKNNDLANEIKINPNDAIYGYLQFTVPEQDLYPFSNLSELHLNCYDILLKKRTVEIPRGTLLNPATTVNLSKAGIKYNP